MKKILCMLLAGFLLILPVSASALDSVQKNFPQSASELLEEASPQDSNFMEKTARSIFQKAVSALKNALRESAASCFAMIAICALIAIGQGFIASSQLQIPNGTMQLAGVGALLTVTLVNAGSLISVCGQTIEEMSMLLRALMPALVSAMAVSGSPVSAAAASSGTMIFADILLSVGKNLIFPAVYCMIFMQAMISINGNELMKKGKALIRWAAVGFYKILLTLFFTYLTMTGILSSAADTAAAKTARVTISGVVPVLGSVLADASETILAGASFIKGAVGVIGAGAAIYVCLGPFIKAFSLLLVYRITAVFGAGMGGAGAADFLEGVGESYSILLGLLASCCAVIFIVMMVCCVVVKG